MGWLVTSCLVWLILAAGAWSESGMAQINSPSLKNSAPKAETSESHLGNGMELLEKGAFQEAANEFRSALKLNPALQSARFHLGVCLLRLSERQAARQEFMRLRSEIGDDPGVIYCLGRLDILDGNFDSAIRHLGQAVRHPPFQDTAYFLGLAYLEKSEYASAENWLRKAAETTPTDPRVPDLLVRLFQRTGRPAEAQEALALAAGLRGRVGERNRLASECSNALESRPSAEARKVCQSLADSQDSDDLAELGQLYISYEHYADAVEPLRRAAELNPESYDLHRNLGTCYFQLKRYAEARAAFEKAVELRPDLFISNALLGATLYALDEEESAYPILTHAYNLNPANKETALVLYKVASVLADRSFAGRDYTSCLNYLRTAAAVRPEDLEIRRRLAEVSARVAKQGEAARER